MTVLGKKHTMATRKRMSAAKRGTKASSAHREAIAEGVRRWWRARRENESALRKEQKAETLRASSLSAGASRVSEVTSHESPVFLPGEA